MNRERAETYLRLLAEAEMRDALSPRAPGSADAPAVGAGAQVRQTGLGPGEHLLSQIAARLLATVPRHQAGPARRAQHRRKILAARPGVRPADEQYGPFGLDASFPFSVWICDSGGRWHAAPPAYCFADGGSHRVLGGRRPGGAGERALTLRLVPPLARSTPWIEVLADGPSAEVRARLPLRWGASRDP